MFLKVYTHQARFAVASSWHTVAKRHNMPFFSFKFYLLPTKRLFVCRDKKVIHVLRSAVKNIESKSMCAQHAFPNMLQFVKDYIQTSDNHLFYLKKSFYGFFVIQNQYPTMYMKYTLHLISKCQSEPNSASNKVLIYYGT